MTVCYFGIYDSNYSRNRILIKGLKQNGVKVIECQSRLKGIKKYFEIIQKHKKIKNDYDILIVGFPGYQATILAYFLTRKKIIFDAFSSIYESAVFDRKKIKEKSFKALYYWLLDFFSCYLADKVLLDTNEHIKYFVHTFKVNKKKFIRLFVGSDNSVFYPKNQNKTNNDFIVHFHGTFIPLQGVEYILDATKLLKNENIKFNIIGSKIKKLKSSEEYKNVNFINNISFEELANYIVKADICLGIFGKTKKTKRVIPNKVYECVACKKAVITADTPAIRELFNDNDLIFTHVADSKVLATAILNYKNNFNKMKYLAENSYNKFTKLTTTFILGKELKKIIKDLI